MQQLALKVLVSTLLLLAVVPSVYSQSGMEASTCHMFSLLPCDHLSAFSLVGDIRCLNWHFAIISSLSRLYLWWHFLSLTVMMAHSPVFLSSWQWLKIRITWMRICNVSSGILPTCFCLLGHCPGWHRTGLMSLWEDQDASATQLSIWMPVLSLLQIVLKPSHVTCALVTPCSTWPAVSGGFAQMVTHTHTHTHILRYTQVQKPTPHTDARTPDLWWKFNHQSCWNVSYPGLYKMTELFRMPGTHTWYMHVHTDTDTHAHTHTKTMLVLFSLR